MPNKNEEADYATDAISPDMECEQWEVAEGDEEIIIEDAQPSEQRQIDARLAAEAERHKTAQFNSRVILKFTPPAQFSAADMASIQRNMDANKWPANSTVHLLQSPIGRKFPLKIDTSAPPLPAGAPPAKQQRSDTPRPKGPNVA